MGRSSATNNRLPGSFTDISIDRICKDEHNFIIQINLLCYHVVEREYGILFGIGLLD